MVDQSSGKGQNATGFAYSSQKKCWTFTHAKLEELRITANSRAIRRFGQTQRTGAKRSLDATPAPPPKRMSLGTPDPESAAKKMKQESIENNGAASNRMSMEGTGPVPFPRTPESKAIAKTITFDVSPNPSAVATPQVKPEMKAPIVETPGTLLATAISLTSLTTPVAKKEEAKEPSYRAQISGTMSLTPTEQPITFKKSDFLSLSEEAIMRLYWEKTLYETVETNFPANRGQAVVMLTALAYFKRFYLANSVMEHDPRNIMVTCINLAAKAEEWQGHSGMDLPKLAAATNTKAERIVRLEVVVLDKISFHLKIWHAYKPLKGHIAGMLKLVGQKNMNITLLEKLERVGIMFIQQSFYTDACFLYYPSQIALAALLTAAEQENAKEHVVNYITSECEKSAANQSKSCLEEVMSTLKAISILLHQGMEARPNIQAARSLDRKLKLFKKRVSQENKKASEKAKKAKELKRKEKLRRAQKRREEEEATLTGIPLGGSFAVKAESDDDSFIKRPKPTPERMKS